MPAAKQEAELDVPPLRILGIDPGYARLGFGLVQDSPDKREPTLVTYGVWETKAKTPHADRLCQLKESLVEILSRYEPHVLSIEKLYFARNHKTALAVAEARGVVLCGAREHGLDIVEYTPLQIKMAVTGHGRSDKEEMQEMVRLLLRMERRPSPDDAADGLAAALAYWQEARFRERVGGL
jgi:crossover junction endodeoxyribonuclease RuvC